MDMYGLKDLFLSGSAVVAAASDQGSGSASASVSSSSGSGNESGSKTTKHVDYSQLEYAVAQIELMGRQIEIIREIENRFFAHFIFLLILATRAAIAEDEARFGEFNAWLRATRTEWAVDTASGMQ